MTSRFLPAAVLPAGDPLADNVARVVPPDAKLRKVGSAVVGYTVPRELPTEFKKQRYTRLEMAGRHVRNVMTSIAWLRRASGAPVGVDTGWTIVASEVAAAILGPGITPTRVANMCIAIGFEADPAELVRATQKAASARQDDGFQIMSAAAIGKLINFRFEERCIIAKELGKKRIGILPVDDPDRRKQKRHAYRSARARGTGSREERQPWKAMGVSRSKYYADGHHRVDYFSDLTLCKGCDEKQSSTPGYGRKSVHESQSKNDPEPDLMGCDEKQSKSIVDRHAFATSEGSDE